MTPSEALDLLYHLGFCDRLQGCTCGLTNAIRLVEAAVRAEQAAEVGGMVTMTQGEYRRLLAASRDADGQAAEVERLRAALEDAYRFAVRAEPTGTCDFACAACMSVRGYHSDLIEPGFLCAPHRAWDALALAAAPFAPAPNSSQTPAPAAPERCAWAGCVWKRKAHPGQPDDEYATPLADHPFQPEPVAPSPAVTERCRCGEPEQPRRIPCCNACSCPIPFLRCEKCGEVRENRVHSAQQLRSFHPFQTEPVAPAPAATEPVGTMTDDEWAEWSDAIAPEPRP